MAEGAESARARRRPGARPTLAGFLGQLDGPQLTALTARGRRRRYPRGATLFQEGDHSDRVVVIQSGRVKLSSFTDEGKEIVLAVRAPGDMIGELSTIDGEPRSATATALDPVEVVVIPAEDFKAVVAGQPGIGLLILETLSRRLRESDRRRIEFGTYDSVTRVARHLVELAGRFGEQGETGVRISLPLSQQELAAWLGLSREAVNSALARLRRRGWIETRRKGITILDLGALSKRTL